MIVSVLAKQLNIQPDKCLAFEDALSGVKSAISAGMHCISCPDVRLELQPFQQLTPYILTSLEEFSFEDWNFIQR